MKGNKREKDIIDDLSEEELKNLDEAIAEADRGEGISLEGFKKQTQQWRDNSAGTSS